MVGVAEMSEALGDWQGALEKYTYAITHCHEVWQGDIFRAYFGRSHIYDQRGMDSLAEADLLEGIQVNPLYPETYYYLGRLVLEHGDTTKARSAYRFAVMFARPIDSVKVQRYCN